MWNHVGGGKTDSGKGAGGWSFLWAVEETLGRHLADWVADG